MQNKELKFDKEARDSIKEGIDALANAVKSTLGPKGRCVVISDYDHGQPHVTKDGVTVAKNIQFRDAYKNAGACLIREAALKTVASVGDSTTSATVLAQSMIQKASELLDKGYNPITLKNEINEIVPIVIEEINKFIKPVSEENLEQIATISANNDPEIGKLVSDMFKSITKDGVVVVEESSNINTFTNVINGMQFDKGYISPHFVTDRVKDECVLEKPLILITEHKLLNTKDVLDILNYAANNSRSIVIIAEEFDQAVIENFKLNKLRNVFNCCLIPAPSHGKYRKEFLQDIAIVTGAHVIDYDSGLELRDANVSDLGTCEKMIITNKSTTIVNGIGSKEDIETRVAELRNELKEVEEAPGMDGSFMIDFIKKRIAKLIGGIAVIYVGGTTELEMKERKDRVDDAVAATRSALEGGIVPGGGITFRNVARNLSLTKNGSNPAYTLIEDALDSIFKTIVINAGADLDSIRIDMECFNTKTLELIGWDAVSNKVVNMLDAGIIDPAKANLLSFQNAISVLNLFLSTNCVITPEPQIIAI